jgi:hypothetical protein
MDKYHINPETGNPGLCSAKIKCPFGGDDVHYFSKEAAQQAFEEATKTEALKAWKKKKVNPEPEQVAAPDTNIGHGRSTYFHGYVSTPAPKPKAKPRDNPTYGSHGMPSSGGHGGYGSGFGGHGR